MKLCITPKGKEKQYVEKIKDYKEKTENAITILELEKIGLEKTLNGELDLISNINPNQFAMDYVLNSHIAPVKAKIDYISQVIDKCETFTKTIEHYFIFNNGGCYFDKNSTPIMINDEFIWHCFMDKYDFKIWSKNNGNSEKIRANLEMAIIKYLIKKPDREQPAGVFKKDVVISLQGVQVS